MEGTASIGAKAVASRVAAREDLEAVIVELAEIMRDTGLSRTLAIGQLVLERFFGGSFETWRDRRRNKNNSVRRLADTPNCPLSRSALNQAIGVFAVVNQAPHLRAFEHIGPSHITVVLPLSAAVREDWLRLANHEHWSVRRLEEEIHNHRRNQGERRGRPRASRLAKSLTRLRSALRATETALSTLAELELEHETAAELSELATRLTRLAERTEMLRQKARTESGVMLKAIAVQRATS